MYIPVGQVLIVDRSTPKLNLILVEGTIIFFNTDLTIQAETILVSKGTFIAGTQAIPFVNKLTFILSGDYSGKQLPEFGNKAIGCYNCHFSIHGKTRAPVWTELSETAAVGATVIKVATAVDWIAGEEIVIASSSYEHSEAERRTIASIDGTKKEITLTQALTYKHFSADETFGAQTGALRTEVGLLTRNIKIQGDSTSTISKYGVHVMMVGSTEDSLVSKIEYVELSNCGQQRTLRNCISFNRNSNLGSSIVRGNSIHNSFARVVALKSSSYLTI